MQLIYGIIFAITVACIAIAFKILPGSPFLAYMGLSEFNEYLPYINYFIPIDAFIVMSEAWLAALSIWLVFKFGVKAAATCSDLSPLN